MNVTAQAPARSRTIAEIIIVLALSLGTSAVSSIVTILDRLTREQALRDQSTTLNSSLSERPYIDLAYQLIGILSDLAPVALVCLLLWSPARPHLQRIGIDGRRWLSEFGWGAVLALGVGVPGLAAYLGARALGITVSVQAEGLDAYWWTVPVLVLSAIRSGVEEEVIMIGYLFARTRELGWRPWTAILVSAGIRGTYHLYQGIGAFAANAAMGVLFGLLYMRFGRLLPLVVAHALIDVVAFLGYPLGVGLFPELFA